MAFASTPRPGSPSPSGEDNRYTYFPLALAVMTTIFFMWGFLTCLNDILIPHLKALFELSYFKALLIQFTFFGAYFLMSIPAGRVVATLGYKKGIVAGLAVAAVGAAGFWPAASLHSYAAFLVALFVLATGITVLQVAANPYVALLGPEKTSSSRLNLAQALNSLGTTLAPIFGGLLILTASVSSIPKDAVTAPETRELVTSINQGPAERAMTALAAASADHAAAALNQAATPSIEKLPTPALVRELTRLPPAQLGEVLGVLPTDKVLATLQAQSPGRLTAMPAEKLATALDNLRATRLSDDQDAQLKGIISSLPAAAGEQLAAYRNTQAESVQKPYIGLAIVLLLLAGGVWLFKLPTLTETTGGAEQAQHTFTEALSHPHVKFGVLAIFFYVGAEVSLGSFMINYLSLPEIGHMSQNQASHYVGFYWGGAMVGRIIGAALLVNVSPRKLLALFATIAGLLVLTTMLGSGAVSVYSIIAIGLFNSIMFPTIFALGIEHLGPLTGKASSLLVMAIVGGALIPVLQGVLADHIGLQHAFFLPLICYAYIVFYGVSGSKVRNLP
jgi:MFS transporter, FHS family, L-fucose permease